jgi:hypothetical protein
MSMQVQKFVFGRDIQTPTLNVASIFLTGAQFKEPGRNFARFLLMMFILWSLIIRQRITTVDELNQKNFTLLYPRLFYRLFNETNNRQVKRLKLQLNLVTFWFIFKFRIKFSKQISNADEPDDAALAEHQNKLTYFVFREATRKLKRTVRPSYRFLDENSATLQFSLFFNRNNFYNKQFIEKVDQLISSGLTQKIESDQVAHNQDRDDEQEARPLTFEHLELCFATFMICLGLCCVVFAIEWIVGCHQLSRDNSH